MNRREVTWRLPSISADGLKNFACIVMLLQSFGIIVVEKGMINLSQYTQQGLSDAMAEDSHLMMLAGVGSVLQLIGGLAVPVFAFLLVEGFRNTSDYRKYMLAVLLLALVSEMPYDLAMSQTLLEFSSQNAVMGTAVSLVMLYLLAAADGKGASGRVLQVMTVLGAVLWVTLLRAQYGLCMVLLAAVLYLFRERSGIKTVLGIVISLLYVTGPLAFYGIWCYSGLRKDRLPKYFYYAFYPLHLLILALAAWVVR